jgi:choline dehydrogenase
VKLSGADPAESPLIDLNFLSDPWDMELMKECVHWGRRIMETAAFRPYLGEERYPGKGVQSDAEIETYIRQHAESGYHPVGTCKMGNDAMAVVDARLKVHGIEGLRVADASVMPQIISGNTNATAIMIGRRAADLITQTNAMTSRK